MDVNALRTWGMAVSAAAMAGALAVAFMDGGASREMGASAAADVEAGVYFSVAFQGAGPLARAAEARDADAVAAQLRRQIDLDGLCFERFEASAVVLRSCALIASAERHEFQRAWLQRLRSMHAVAYANPEPDTLTTRAGE